MAQAVIAWWYSDNLLVVWLGLVGLAAVFYFVPKLTSRDLHSRYLALLTFWMLILFGSWGGIPASAPVPAWMPVSSAVATVLGVIADHRRGPERASAPWKASARSSWAIPRCEFIGFGLVAFIVGGLGERCDARCPRSASVTQFTWFTIARGLLNSYGFFAMVMFGAVYYIVPQLMGLEFPSPKLVRAHFWTAAAGVLLFVVPLAAGGIVQGLKLQHADIPFTDIAKGTLPFLRVSTMGDLLMALGHLMFLANLAGLVFQFYRARAVSAWAEATAEIQAGGGQAMNYGPLVFLAAFFALASSWCGFVLTPQLQIGRLQQTNTVSGAAVTYPVARPGLARQGLEVYRANGCAYCHSQQVGQTGTLARDCADRCRNQPGRHHRGAAQAWPRATTDEPAVLDGAACLGSCAGQMPAATNLLSGLPKAFLRSSTRQAAKAAVKALNSTSAKAQLWIVPVGPDLARGWGKRRTVAEDFLFDSPVMPGSQRVGPDLANVGTRLPDANGTCFTCTPRSSK